MLETGDVTLAALPDGAVVERQTPGNLHRHWPREI